MATRTFSAHDENVEDVRSFDRRTAGRVSVDRYQLSVVAASTADVVRSAGGWLCDCARAGWDVNVLIADHDDTHALAILGTTVLERDGGVTDVMRRVSHGGVLAVSTHLLTTDERVSTEIVRVLKRGLTEVAVWGDGWPAELGRKVDPVEHKLSAAARAFKTHALYAAANSKSPVADTETLFCLGADSFRPLYSV